MKILTVKRLESSFPAFLSTVGRFIRSYERVITEFHKGHVYISKKHISKIFDLSKPITRKALIVCWKSDKAQKLDRPKEFNPEFIKRP